MTYEQIIKQLSELIDDREAFCISDPERDEIYIKDINALKAAIEVLENAEPVKHGRWEKHDNLMGEYYHCSVCDTRTEVATCMGDPIFVYCPYCGARMDGEAK